LPRFRSRISGVHTFDYLCSLLDGWSRFMVHWELREGMTEADVEQVPQRAREKFPGVTPRIISDDGPQLIARDFKEFIRLRGMTPARTSPYYRQSNGKIERWHRILKEACICAGTPLTPDGARRIVDKFVAHSNTVRLHSAIGHVAPQDILAGRAKAIHDARDRKLEAVRERRKAQCHAARQAALDGQPATATTGSESVAVPQPPLRFRRPSSWSR
jgi:transposase InsO family protein